MPANSFIRLEKELSLGLFCRLLPGNSVEGRETASLSDCGVLLAGVDGVVVWSFAGTPHENLLSDALSARDIIPPKNP